MRLASSQPFDVCAERLFIDYAGRPSRGPAPRPRAAYASLVHGRVIPYFGRTPMGDLGRLTSMAPEPSWGAAGGDRHGAAVAA